MKFFIDQYGCAKNQVDGEEIAARLEDAGHRYTASGEEADLIIVNTCGFIEAAKRESIGAIVAAKTRWPEKKILAAGCLAQRYPAELLADMAEADGVFGNADLSLVALSAQKTLSGERAALAPRPPAELSPVFYRRRRLFDYPGSAHIKITEGCDNRCSFCAIPLIRGGLRSRSPEDVLRECRELIGRGIYEINLIGQDLASYGRDFPAQGARGAASGLAALLAGLSALEGDFQMRLLYIHPDNFPRGILDIMAADPRILPYFDLPFQHASERVLRAMNRRGSARGYLDLIALIRSSLPESMIRSTFLVGFPGETEEDFAALRAFQDEARLDWLGVFAYSREEDTPAYSIKGRVGKKTAAARKAAIEAAQEAIGAERLRRFVGARVEVLVEETVEGENLSLGRAWMQAPEVDGLSLLKKRARPGERVLARIVAVNGVDFEAEPSEGCR